METAAANAEMHARHARMLGRLAELGMALAEDLQGRALAAEAPAEAAQLASAFHKLSRSVRQSLALEARLVRDAARAERAAADQAEAEAKAEASAPLARRRAEVKAKLDSLVWTEAETELAASFWDAGAARLLAAAEYEPGFADRPVEAVVAELAHALRAQAPRDGGPGKPEQVEFVWKIVDVDGVKRDWATGEVEPYEPDSS